VIPTAITISASTTISPGPVSSGIPLIYLFIILIVVLLLIILLLFLRRRGFTVEVQDKGTRSPIQGASVLADGPENLSGITEKDGEVKFGKVKEGDYTVKATAAEFFPSTPETIKVENKTEYTVLLSRIPPVTQVSAPPMMPPPIPQTQQPPATVTQPVQQGQAPIVAQPVPPPAPSEEARPEEQDDMGGGRINEIIRKFQAKGAISPETALTAEELGLSRLFVRIMKRRKGKTTIFMEINGKYYLNQKALDESK
jgi:carboxypeptidase family protein